MALRGDLCVLDRLDGVAGWSYGLCFGSQSALTRIEPHPARQQRHTERGQR